MSLRIIYRRTQPSKRLCNYYRCQKPILRNIDRDKDGRLYNHGCLMSAQDEQYRCLECFSIFDATKAGFTPRQIIQGDSIGDGLQIVCPNCGCMNLKPLSLIKEA
jgi:DNA-directed RNA polymerase subunit RPC12/RpoP